MTADGKVRTWAFWLLAAAIAWQFYLVRDLLAAFALFAIGFGVLAFVVLSLYLLQKGWELTVVRIFDSGRWIARCARDAIRWLTEHEHAESKWPQELKTEKTNSKDCSCKGTSKWIDGENSQKEFEGTKQ